MDIGELIALHGHYLATDAVKQFLFTDVPIDEKTAGQLGDLVPVAQFWSTTYRLQVFYALLYVVVEGYRDFGGYDRAVDQLLEYSDYVDALRRFRNAVFHPQAQPISPKLTAFLAAEGSESWIYNLNQALKDFLESQLGMKGFLQSQLSMKEFFASEQPIEKAIERLAHDPDGGRG